MVGEHPTQSTLPADALKPAWRAACIAYRKVRQSGQGDQPGWLSARAAILELHPGIGDEEAGKQAVAAVSYASVNHPTWLWHRVGDPKYWKS